MLKQNDKKFYDLEPKVCKLILYTMKNFGGFKIDFETTTGKIQPLAQSLRTIGPCCWRIAR
jgi:hypothetical protein